MSELRRRLGETRRKLTARPVRLRRPVFSPTRELRRCLGLHDRMLAGAPVTHDEWETHQPVLIELLRHVPSPRVLELGVGYGSTPIVLGLSGESVSLETNEAWFDRFARYATREHRVALQRDYSEYEWDSPYFDEEWDVVLIDNSPAWSRQSNLAKLADRARFLVCHDTEECFKDSASDYRWDFRGYRHVWTYDRFPTYTTVVSNVDAIPVLHLGGVEGETPLRRA